MAKAEPRIATDEHRLNLAADLRGETRIGDEIFFPKIRGIRGNPWLEKVGADRVKLYASSQMTPLILQIYGDRNFSFSPWKIRVHPRNPRLTKTVIASSYTRGWEHVGTEERGLEGEFSSRRSVFIRGNSWLEKAGADRVKLRELTNDTADFTDIRGSEFGFFALENPRSSAKSAVNKNCNRVKLYARFETCQDFRKIFASPCGRL